MICEGEIVAVNNDLQVISCKSCGFAHLYPLPDMSEYYAEDRFYTTHSPFGWLKKEVEEYKHGMWDAAYTRQTQLLFSDYKDVLVDVGTGTGTFVDFCHRMGYSNVYGIEPSQSARIVSPVKPGHMFKDFESYEIKERPFNRGDISIRMSLVLEHISDPATFIRGYTPVMGKTGRMMIIVPNEFNRLQRAAGGNWFVSNVHVNYFTPQSLKELLESVGLRVIYRSATFPMELFLMFGLDYRKIDRLGKDLHRFRLWLEKKVGPRIFNLYRAAHLTWGWGREMIMVAENDV